MKKIVILLTLFIAISCTVKQPFDNASPPQFNPGKDLLSLHYDHAPDKDDGHSAAADRTLLQSLYGKKWIVEHVVVVSGAYGTNAAEFNPDSDLVMDVAWNDCGGWLSAHNARSKTIDQLTVRWSQVIEKGGYVWVKEGGQSDLTAQVLAKLIKKIEAAEVKKRVFVVQHHEWNEAYTTPKALIFTKEHAQYTRIRDANTYLKKNTGVNAFIQAALVHPDFSACWETAFAYYNPVKYGLDFSDTGILMHILGLGEINIDAFQRRFLQTP